MTFELQWQPFVDVPEVTFGSSDFDHSLLKMEQKIFKVYTADLTVGVREECLHNNRTAADFAMTQQKIKYYEIAAITKLYIKLRSARFQHSLFDSLNRHQVPETS